MGPVGITVIIVKLWHKNQIAYLSHAAMIRAEWCVVTVRICCEVIAIAVVWIECVYLWRIRHIIASVAVPT